jgi:hypothetical protein
MTGSTAVLADAQITQLCDHRGLGRHFLAIAPIRRVFALVNGIRPLRQVNIVRA